MKALFIGGTGVISSACSRLAVERGIDLTLINRGRSKRPIPSGIHLLQADVRDRESYSSALDGDVFDVVVNWIVYTPEQLEVDLQLLQGRTAQYIFISSASAYQTPPVSLPVTESTPLDNPYWEYSRLKAACEQRLLQAYRHDKFPMTIVRPSHTYDQTLSPLQGGYTMIARMRSNRPVVVHGDGTSLWTLTHHEDFARGFVGLMGNPRTIGESFHITSDEILTWNQIYQIIGHAAGAEPQLVHVPSELIAAYDPIWGAGLLGDKTQSMVFDNTKIKRLVPDFVASIPFSQGAEKIIDWYDADPARQQVDQAFDRLLDRIIAAYRQAWPEA